MQQGNTRKAIAIWALRVGLALVLGVAAIQKLGNPIAFSENIRGFRLVGDPWAAWIAMGLPVLELLVALLLLLGRWCYRGAILMAAAMFLLFGAVILSAWIRGLDIACGCFGVSGVTGEFGKHLLLWVFPPLVMSIFLWSCEGSTKILKDSETGKVSAR